MEVGVFNVVPEFSETLLISFQYIPLFCSASVTSTSLSSTLLIRSSASCILPLVASNEFFISVIVFCIYTCLSFQSCISLLSVSHRLSFSVSSLFPMSCIIFSIISLKSFSWRLIISRSPSCFSGVFPCSLGPSYSSLPFHFYRFGLWCPFWQTIELLPLFLLMSAPPPHALWLKLEPGVAVGFLMGGTGACPLVSGTDSYPSGGWGFVSGWDERGLCAQGFFR